MQRVSCENWLNIHNQIYYAPSEVREFQSQPLFLQCFCRNTQLHKRTLACNGEETPPPLEAIIVIPEGRRDIIPAELSEVGGQNKRFFPVK